MAPIGKGMSPKLKAKKAAKRAAEAEDPNLPIWQQCESIEQRAPHLANFGLQRWVFDQYLLLKPRRTHPNSSLKDNYVYDIDFRCLDGTRAFPRHEGVNSERGENRQTILTYRDTMLEEGWLMAVAGDIWAS